MVIQRKYVSSVEAGVLCECVSVFVCVSERDKGDRKGEYFTVLHRATGYSLNDRGSSTADKGTFFFTVSSLALESIQPSNLFIEALK
jgi:hypothetical protein